MQTKLKYLLYGIILPSLFACSGRPTINSNLKGKIKPVILSDSQLVRAKIRTAKINKNMFSDTIRLEGIIESSPKDRSVVSAPIKSFVKKIMVEDGSYVQKGEVLAILEHPEIIKLQQAYLEAKSEYDYRRIDLERQGDLSLDHATSLKIQQQAQNAYQKAEVNYRSLKKQLEYIGINTDSLNTDNIRFTYSLRAPMSGYLTYNKIENGILCKGSVPLFTIYKGTGSIVKLILPDSLDQLLRSNKQFTFFPLSFPGKRYTAVLPPFYQQGIAPHQQVRARIVRPEPILKTGTRISAIFVKQDSAWSISSRSIFTYGNKKYVFIMKSSDTFVPCEIKTGKTVNGISQLIRSFHFPYDSLVVTSGTTYLRNQMVNQK